MALACIQCITLKYDLTSQGIRLFPGVTNSTCVSIGWQLGQSMFASQGIKLFPGAINTTCISIEGQLGHSVLEVNV